jgi:hypothetical protein
MRKNFAGDNIQFPLAISMWNGCSAIMQESEGNKFNQIGLRIAINLIFPLDNRENKLQTTERQ